MDPILILAVCAPVSALPQSFEEERLLQLNTSSVVIFADFDGDGRQDLIRLGTTRGQIVWAPQRADGRFDGLRLFAEFPVEEGFVPAWLEAADLDGDGVLDLVMTRDSTNIHEGYTAWFRGLGGGVVEPFRLITRSLEVRGPARAVDFDGDGRLDVVGLRGDGAVVWQPNLGAVGGAPASFGPAVALTAGGVDVWAVSAADLDGDGDPDLVASSGSDGHLLIVENLGGGAFVPGVDQGFRTGSFASFGVGDLDGDGDLDVAGANRATSELVWFENDGTGALVAERVVGATLEVPLGIFVGDVDGDGDVDICNGRITGAGGVDFVEALGGGSFAAARPLIPGSLARPDRNLGLADIDGDGLLEFWANEGRIRWVDTSAPPSTWEPRELGMQDVGSEGACTLDFDGDGDLDIARTEFRGLVLIENEGDGTFVDERVVAPEIHSANPPYAADLDGDGLDDLVTTEGIFTDNVTIWIHRNLGGGLFEAPRALINGNGGSFLEPSVRVGDAEGDGDVDLYVSLATARWLINDGTGHFTPGPSGSLGPMRGVAADLDGDGTTEFVEQQPVFTGPTAPSYVIRLYRTLPSGAVGAVQVLLTYPIVDGAVAQPIAVDLTGDGLLDLVALDGGRSVLVVFRALGAGTFDVPRDLVTLPGPARSLVAADVDLNGTMDLIVASVGELRWYPNVGGGVLGAPAAIDHRMVGPEFGDILVGDVNGDGAMDLIKARRQGTIVQRSQYSAGSVGCAASAVNSIGRPGVLRATGSAEVAVGALILVGSDLPPGQFGMFIVGSAAGSTVNPGGSMGTLCLGGAVGRFNGPGEIRQVDLAGRLLLRLDLGAVPVPVGTEALVPGDTRYFQLWHRDGGAGAPSNFTGSLAITFR